MNVVIAGKGAFGTALHSVICANTKTVSFWQRGEAINSCDVLILAVPTEAIRSVLEFLESSSCIIVNCSKGIESLTHKLPYEITKECVGDNVQYFSLMGPSFSREVMDKTPTLVNLAYASDEHVSIVKHLFQTDYFRVHQTLGIEAIELAASFKNIYAVASGIVEGLGFGMNTRAKLITLALEEFYSLCSSLNFPIQTSAMPAIVGDLVLSCSSETSRNFSFGKLLCETSVDQALKTVHATVEGYNSASSVRYFAKKSGQKLPLASFVATIVKDNTNMKERFFEFTRQV